MKTDPYDNKTNLKTGEQILEDLPNDIRPGWAGLILSRFNNYIQDRPEPIIELFSIVGDKERWNQAHDQFTKIRSFLLDKKDFKPEAYLLLAELVAKVTFNASGSTAPFDSDSGHCIPSTALQAAEYFKDERLEEDVISAILLFTRNRKFKTNLKAAKDFLLYKKIDGILWFDWDPIGVREFGPRDEYQGYLPEIFALVKDNADQKQIADCLFKFETERMGLPGSVENCMTVAGKILRISSHK